ncbi:MAG: hypothetical protein JO170_31795 [Verrucomicrobia bacterium]|nr:hypothetical protein [Verrucomicrobiota bacterium]
MTQAEIAKQYGVSQSAVSRWKTEGCDLDDPAEVAQFAEIKACRSRGITRKRKLAHHARRIPVRRYPTLQEAITRLLSDGEDFVLLPMPLGAAIVLDVYHGLCQMQDAWEYYAAESHRLNCAEADEHYTECVEKIQDALKALDYFVGSYQEFDDEVARRNAGTVANASSSVDNALS